MTQPSEPKVLRSMPAPGRRLSRTALLASSENALVGARKVERQAAGRHPNDATLHCVERLGAHREILARRAANVALASTTTVDELGDLRDAIRHLIAVHGWAARKLGLVGRMN